MADLHHYKAGLRLLGHNWLREGDRCQDLGWPGRSKDTDHFGNIVDPGERVALGVDPAEDSR